MKLLRQRQENLEIKSPIDGIVTVGDLEKAEGAPVTCGQTLFEIAPLTKMVVEIAIPESDVSYVHKGQKVEIYFEAYPNELYEAEISKVRPRSEIRDQQNVFIAEATLSNPEENLRPGMHGSAKVLGSRRMLGWILFHKPWESLCMMIGW
jgi:multidrug resistance efflux pump